MKKTMVILVVMLVALAGCKKTSPKETAVEEIPTIGTAVSTGQWSNGNDPAGVYTLFTVNGSKLPTTASHGDVKIEVHSGTFTINADGTCSSKIIFGSPSGDKFTRQVNATYTQEGSRLNMQWIGAGRTKGIVKEDTFTMNNEGMIFSYKKQPAPAEGAAVKEEKIPAPGYRPESDHSAAFLSSVGTCRMVVFPTVVRTKSTANDGFIMNCNKASQQTILKHLTKKDVAETNACMTELDLSRAEGKAQWGFFQSSMKLMADQIKQSNMETDYHLAMEVIIVPRPNGRLAVFGIHVYILDQAGHNAFSFLLNSHHQLFISAELHTEDSSKESIEKLIVKSTQVALKALEQQIQLAK